MQLCICACSCAYHMAQAVSVVARGTHPITGFIMPSEPLLPLRKLQYQSIDPSIYANTAYKLSVLCAYPSALTMLTRRPSSMTKRHILQCLLRTTPLHVPICKWRGMDHCALKLDCEIPSHTALNISYMTFNLPCRVEAIGSLPSQRQPSLDLRSLPFWLSPNQFAMVTQSVMG